jgi:protein gp37
MAIRLAGRNGYPFKDPFSVTLHPDRIEQPLRWKKPLTIFVCSMSDYFHEDVPKSFLFNIIEVIQKCPQHIFQILTKRVNRMLEISEEMGDWPDNVWIGATVESKEYEERIEFLRKINASIKFLSFEPLLSILGDLNLDGISWVIVGGESGPRARSMQSEWAINIRDQCLEKNIPYFFKQWGGINKKVNGRKLEGIEWNQMPSLNSLSYIYNF